MNLFKLLKLSRLSLKHEDEINLAYLEGHHPYELPYFKKSNKLKKGVFFRVVAFFYSLIRLLSLRQNENCVDTKVFLYAGTKNQFNSIISTVSGFKKIKVKHVLMLRSNSVATNSSYQIFRLSPKVVLVSMLLFIFNVIPLYLKLKRKDKDKEINLLFDTFCSTYFYIPQFLLYLGSQPSIKMVVMSNDHNVDNRSLRVAAEILNIKTTYIQHASVSELFPPLMFDYALLDGEMAMSTYIKCQAKSLNTPIYKTTIYLSGQKKIIHFNDIVNEKAVGIAVNALDDINLVINLIDKFVLNNYRVIVRTHPAQSPEFISKLNVNIKNNSLVAWSNSNEESLQCFFSSINSLIAANCSIHLEAALAGIPTMYHEFSSLLMKTDYYGYVETGVSFPLNCEDLFNSFNAGMNFANSSVRKAAIKFYSDSYSTYWEHKEGELAAKLIKKIIEKEEVNDLFYKVNGEVYSVYRIKGV